VGDAFVFLVAAAFMVGWVAALVGLIRMWGTRRWPVTNCVAVEIREKAQYEDGRRFLMYSPVVEFTTQDGRHIRDVLGDWSTGLILKVGESAQVKYDPARPEIFRLTGFSRSGASTGVAVFFFAPAAACLLLWWFVFRS
jgi:hypothetical protein